MAGGWLSGRTRCGCVAVVLSLVIATAASALAQATRIDIIPIIDHTKTVKSLVFSPDGKLVLSGSEDAAIKLWDVASGRLLRSFNGHADQVSTLAFHSDGRRIVSGSYDGTIKVWDLATGALLRSMSTNKPNNWITAVALAPDGRRIVSGDTTHNVDVWDIDTGQLITILGTHGDVVWDVAVSRDGRRVLSAGGDRYVALWDLETRQLLRTFQGHKDVVYAAVFLPDGRRGVSASQDGALKFWDLDSGREVAETTAHKGLVYSLSATPTGNQVLSGSWDATLRLWDGATGRQLRQFDAIISSASAAIDAVALSPDGRLAVSGGADRAIRLWDATTGHLIRTFGTHEQGNRIISMSVSPDGRRLLVGNFGVFEDDSDRTLKIWDLATGQFERGFQKGHTTGVRSVTFSPDGRQAVTAGSYASLTLWDSDAGAIVRKFSDVTSTAWCAGFSPDGRRIAVGTGDLLKDKDDDALVRVFEVSTGTLLHTLAGHGRRVTAVAFSPDGRRIVSGSADSTLKLWDAASGKLLRTFTGHGNFVEDVTFSPDGRRVLSGAIDGTAILWDADSGLALRTLSGHGNMVTSVAFSGDGRLALTGSWDTTVKLWDVQSGRMLRTLSGHHATVNTVAFAPGGTNVLSGSDDGTVRIWRAEDGALLATLIGSGADAWLAITPEGYFVGTAKGAEMLNVVRGVEPFAIDQVYDVLYRPDLVKEKLAGDAKGMVKEAAAKLDLNKVLASGSAPRVRIVSPRDGAGVSDEKVTVEAEIADTGGGVGRVEWRVNGVTLGLDARGFERVQQNARKVSQTLFLEPGDNTIEAIAYNAKNLIASVPARIALRWDGERAKTPPRLHVLAVGVNDYWDSRLRLTNAVTDARSLADAMRQAGSGVFESVNVTTLLDADVTADKLQKTFETLGRSVRARDVFVLYLAGHGKTLDGRYYFIPQDFRYVDESSIARSGIGQERWQDWLAQVPARKSVLVYDTCESGSLTQDKTATRGLEQVAALEKLTRAMGRTVLSASSEVAPALEGYNGHGVFTYALLEGLSRGDANGNGLIEVTEIAQYLDAQVPDISYRAFRIRQVPQMRIQGSNFPLGKATAVLPAATGAAAPIPSAPTHVVIRQADVFAAAGGAGAATQRLAPGTLVTLVRSGRGWMLVAKGGRELGYVAESTIAAMQ